MDEERPHTLRSRLLTGLAGLLAALLLYVLSVGPVGYVLIRWRLEEIRLVNFYYPVGWLTEHTPYHGPLNTYVRWWIALAEAHREAAHK